MSAELERRLIVLGGELELPPEPDLASAVVARLHGRPFPWRSVALAAAVLAAALAAVLAVPQARTALLRWFHLGGATVIRVEKLPPAVERSQAGGLGEPLPLAQAERRVRFRLALPRFEGGPPTRAYVVGDSLATVVVRGYGVRLLLSEFSSSGARELKKLAADATLVEPVRVDGRPGLWLAGGTHTLTYIDRHSGYHLLRPIRIHGNVLLWARDGLTLRLEGRLTKAQALELARTVR